MSQAAKKLDLQQVKPAVETPNEAPVVELEVNRRVLVVEDEREIAKAYKNILSPETNDNVVPLRRSSRRLTAEEQKMPSSRIPPYEVVVAHSGEEALKYVEDAVKAGKPFALGFIDVLLGAGIDGIELVRRIQALDSEMYFVFVTAYQDRSVDAIHDLLGPQVAERWDYLTKPFSEGEIIQKARSSISHWNLKYEKDSRDRQMAELQRRIWDSERLVSVAAVARSMGHEFGNILVQIIGRADLARRKKESEMRDAFEQIMKSGELASQVLDRFKDLSKSQNAESKRKLLRLAQPVDDAILLMDHQLKISNVKVCRTKWDQALVVGAASSLTQVVVNLIINSVHAMEKEEQGQIDFSIERTSEWVELKIRDYGPGIPEDIIGKVTMPFFTTKGDNGTGLGLSICKEILEIEHGGEFEIRNHSVKGVEAVIRLPLPTTRKEDL